MKFKVELGTWLDPTVAPVPALTPLCTGYTRLDQWCYMELAVRRTVKKWTDGVKVGLKYEDWRERSKLRSMYRRVYMHRDADNDRVFYVSWLRQRCGSGKPPQTSALGGLCGNLACQLRGVACPAEHFLRFEITKGEVDVQLFKMGPHPGTQSQRQALWGFVSGIMQPIVKMEILGSLVEEEIRAEVLKVVEEQIGDVGGVIPGVAMYEGLLWRGDTVVGMITDACTVDSWLKLKRQYIPHVTVGTPPEVYVDIFHQNTVDDRDPKW